MHISQFSSLLIIKTIISLQSLLSGRLLKKHCFQSKDLKCNKLDAEIPYFQDKDVNMTINAKDWQCLGFCKNILGFLIACICAFVLER